MIFDAKNDKDDVSSSRFIGSNRQEGLPTRYVDVDMVVEARASSGYEVGAATAHVTPASPPTTRRMMPESIAIADQELRRQKLTSMQEQEVTPTDVTEGRESGEESFQQQRVTKMKWSHSDETILQVAKTDDTTATTSKSQRMEKTISEENNVKETTKMQSSGIEYIEDSDHSESEIHDGMMIRLGFLQHQQPSPPIPQLPLLPTSLRRGQVVQEQETQPGAYRYSPSAGAGGPGGGQEDSMRRLSDLRSSLRGTNSQVLEVVIPPDEEHGGHNHNDHSNVLPHRQEELVAARLVDDYEEDQGLRGEAQPVDLERKELQQRNQQKRTIVSVCMAVFLLLVAIVAAAVAGAAMTKKNTARVEEDLLPSNPTSSRTNSPSDSPSTVLQSQLDLFVDSLPSYTQASLEDPTSPQRLALDWLAQYPNLLDLEDWQWKQKFAMATFFYAFEGPKWPEATPGQDRWMDVNKNECSWPLSDDDVVSWSAMSSYYLGPNAHFPGDFETCNENGELQTLFVQNLYLATNAKPFIPPEIELLSSLKILALMNSEMNAKFSDLVVPEVIQLPHLQSLLFYGNDAISGTIPMEISLMTGLRHLMISSSKLTGSMPTQIGKIAALEHLIMDDTIGINGVLPSEFGLLANLTGLEFYRSSVSGPIPTELGSLVHLRRIYLDGNSLTGSIPSELGLLTATTWLALYENLLTGSLPTELGLMTDTTRLRIWNNGLTGSIPSQLGLMTSMVDFRIGNDLDIEGPTNDFDGSIPTALWNFSHLKWIFLSNLPGLHGSIPTDIGMPNLTMLSLSGSPNIIGTISDEACLFVEELSFDCSGLLCGCDCWCPGDVNKTNLVNVTDL